MKFLAREWTEEDKDLMKKVGFKINNILHQDLKDTIQRVWTLDILYQEHKKLLGFKEVLGIDKNGNIMKNNINRVIGIIKGMEQSNINLILFKDDPEVWMQYYMAMFFELSTYIIADRKDERILAKIATEPLIKQIVYVPEWNETELTKAMNILKESWKP